MLSLFIALILVAFILWIVNLIPGDPTIKKIAFGVAILMVVLWVVSSLFPEFGGGLKLPCR